VTIFGVFDSSKGKILLRGKKKWYFFSCSTSVLGENYNNFGTLQHQCLVSQTKGVKVFCEGVRFPPPNLPHKKRISACFWLDVSPAPHWVWKTNTCSSLLQGLESVANLPQCLTRIGRFDSTPQADD